MASTKDKAPYKVVRGVKMPIQKGLSKPEPLADDEHDPKAVKDAAEKMNVEEKDDE